MIVAIALIFATPLISAGVIALWTRRIIGRTAENLLHALLLIAAGALALLLIFTSQRNLVVGLIASVLIADFVLHRVMSSRRRTASR